MAIVADITGADRVLILDNREALVYPFVSPNWKELRMGWFVSICSAGDNDTISGLAETLGSLGATGDKFWLGFKDSSSNFPAAAGSVFIGIGNQTAYPANTEGSTLLNFNGTAEYKCNTTSTDNTMVQAWDGAVRKHSANSPMATFPQTHASTGGYAGLFIHQFLRPTTTSLAIELNAYFNVRALVQCGSLLFSDVPSISAIRTQLRNLASFSSHVNSGGFTLSAPPTAVFAYWPFNNSRLRIHNVLVEKFL